MKYQHVFICVLLLLISLGSCNSNKVGNGESLVYFDREIKDKMEEAQRERLYPCYKGNIHVENKEEKTIFTYRYDDVECNIVLPHEYCEIYAVLFERGVLHPQFMGCFNTNSLTVGQFVKDIKYSGATKRNYNLRIWCEGWANSLEYSIELQNNRATDKTLDTDFMQEAVLIDISEIRVVI